MRLALCLFALLAVSASAQDAVTVTLAGTVLDAETGDPVVGAGVVIPALGIGAVVQRDGTYAIEGVPPGAHTLRVGAYLYHMRTVEAEVSAQTTPLDLTLSPGAGAGCAVAHDHDEAGGHGGPDGDR